VFSRTGTPELAADPMPPNAADSYVILKPRGQWPDPAIGKEVLIRKLEDAASVSPGNKLEFTQPIQMRFNELIAGVRQDLAIKVFGDDFQPMLRAGSQIAALLKTLKGAADVKVEETQGLPALEIRVDKSEIARRGLSLADVQDSCGRRRSRRSRI
jgi:heavy metal efflux system protein